MAALTHDDVTVLHSWREGGTNGLKFYCKRVTVTTATATTYVAAAFGMREIVDVSAGYNATDGQSTICAVAVDGSAVHLFAPGDGVTAENATDVTFTIKGFES